MPAPQVVFITGASSGIGLALARHYARQGAVLGLAARRAGILQDLCGQLRAEGATAVAAHPLDVAHFAALQTAATDFMQTHGTPDIVIANAGISAGTLTEIQEDLEVMRRILDTNVLGLAATFSPFLPAMRHAGRGRLVGIASVAGVRGLPGAGAYSASKAAAVAYLESLRVELHGSGIRVVTLSPGYIATPMTAANPYPMPFLMPVEKAAPRFARAIDRGSSYCVIPWPMAIVAKLLRLLPNPVFDRLLAAAPRKPRWL